MNDVLEEIKRLNFEELIWIIFIIISILNIIGNSDEINYLKTNDISYQQESNYIFKITLIITFVIYIYFFNRNYKTYENANINEKKLYSIKLLGSSFLIAGIICLIYFQFNQNSFIGSPAI